MNPTHPIPFTQFLMPNGAQNQVSIRVGEPEFEKWKQIRERGFRLTVELLSDYKTVSLCIEDRELGDYDMQICSNRPNDPANAVSKLLLRYNDDNAKEFVKERTYQPPLEPLEVQI